MTKKQEESWTPVTDYEAIMEHALVMAHQLEQVLPVIPMDSELYHRISVELSQYSGWIKHRLDPFLLQSRQQLRLAEADHAKPPTDEELQATYRDALNGSLMAGSGAAIAGLRAVLARYGQRYD